MPISIIVGGQYGSEGKGKIAHWLARKQRARYTIRVGGSNSGHTVVDRGRHSVLRHLPTSALLDDVIAVIPTGAYLDVDILLREAEETGLTKDRLFIHPMAVVMDDSMKADLSAKQAWSRKSPRRGKASVVLSHSAQCGGHLLRLPATRWPFVDSSVPI